MDAIKIGDKVRSYNFDGRDDCYVEGVVEAIGPFAGAEAWDCERLHVRVERMVWQGVEQGVEPGRMAYPPVNGTPTVGGKTTNFVQKLD